MFLMSGNDEQFHSTNISVNKLLKQSCVPYCFSSTPALFLSRILCTCWLGLMHWTSAQHCTSGPHYGGGRVCCYFRKHTCPPLEIIFPRSKDRLQHVVLLWWTSSKADIIMPDLKLVPWTYETIIKMSVLWCCACSRKEVSMIYN